jgi:hemoglobin
MKKNKLVWLVGLMISFAFSSSAFAQMDNKKMDKPEEKSLYERLGGYDALAAVTDDFIGRLLKDKMFAKFFAGASNDTKKRIRQHIVDFLCQATGGPCVYGGRTMKTSHEGLGITKAEWDASVKHLTATLDKFKVPEKEKGEVLTAIGSLEKDIVEKK